MKAMVLKEFGKPLELIDMPIPFIGPNEVLIKVHACGLCGTDLKISSGKIKIIKPPLIMGHEPAGIIEKIGSEVSNVKPGDSVATALYVTCGKCEFCRTNQDTLCINLTGRPGFEFNGGFAEYLKLPASNVFKVSKDIPLNQVALLTDCLATAWHSVLRKAQPKPGHNVLILGAGGLGIHAIQFVKMMGANAIVADIMKEKLDLAKRYGADIVINSKDKDLVDEIKKITNNSGVESVLEFVGIPQTVDNSLNCLKRGGRLVLVGYSPENPFTADSVDIVHSEKIILGSRANTKQDLVEVIKLLEQGKITTVITNYYRLEKINDALKDLKNNKILARSIIEVI
jgi:2-desacetyl-2-hydroxyethyl bacteriochlorophyllide A dehydrogenase